jgi:predicted lactoylglutathione lyase
MKYFTNETYKMIYTHSMRLSYSDAIEHSLKKWESICASKLSFSFLAKLCGLCSRYYTSIGCGNCPLIKKKEGCRDDVGLFNQIENRLYETYGYTFNYSNLYFKNLDKKTQKLILQFRDVIKEIYNEHLNKVSKRDINKEKEMERTLRQMTTAEQQMVRTLVRAKYERGADYTDQDIAKALNTTTRTVAAVKAHVTMQSYSN